MLGSGSNYIHTYFRGVNYETNVDYFQIHKIGHYYLGVPLRSFHYDNNQLRVFQTRHFEKPHFPCFESQKLVKLICDTVGVCNFVANQFN